MEDRQRLIDAHPAGSQTLPESLTFRELQNEEHGIVVSFDTVNRGDVRMAQPSEQPSFTLHPFEAGGIFGERVGKSFQRDVTAKAGIFRAIHFTHAALAELVDDLVASELATVGERQGITSGIEASTCLFEIVIFWSCRK